MGGGGNTHSDSNGVEDSGLPPCQAAARGLEGSFTLVATEGGRRDRVSATSLSSPLDVICMLCQVAELSGLVG